jgi:hypothetical protein
MARYPFVLAALLVPAGAVPAELELGLFAGRSLPRYDQRFNYDPGSLSAPVPLPGVVITQRGTFGLVANGGLAAGVSLAFFPADAFGFEARLDTVGLRVDATGVRYAATVTSTVPALPSFTANLELPPGVVDVDSLTPYSVGLKVRSPGRVRFFLAVGGSRLPKVGVTATQALATGLSRFSPPIAARATIRTAALPSKSQGRWGLTAGAGFQVPLGAKASLQAEARAFRFQRQALGWELVELAPSPVEIELVRDGVAALDPVDFNPTFYQATAGFVLRF